MSVWLALLLVDGVAVASLARCFTGPGELTAALVTLVAVHLVGLAARRGLLRRHRTWWAVAVVAVATAPVIIVLGPAFVTAAGQAGGQDLGTDLRVAWSVFYFKVAPVPELPGLVLVTAWAAGLTGLWGELALWKSRVPPVLALVPAVVIYLFAAALGTSSWRVIGLAGMAGVTCWYLVASARERESTRQVRIVSVDGGLSPGRRVASYQSGALILRMAVLAAAAAAVVGPNLPGARSQALVAWRGLGDSGTRAQRPSLPGEGSVSPQGIEISTLVQVGEEEVNDPSVALFSVHSSVPTRELLAVLDDFNGNSWSVSGSSTLPQLGTFAASLSADVRRPPAPVPDGSGRAELIQVFQIQGLGGRDLPSTGVPLAVDGAGRVTEGGPGGTLVSGTAFSKGSTYAVRSVIADPSAAELEAAATETTEARFVELPASVPRRLVALANSVVAGAATPYEKALDIEAYLTSSRFHYRLPVRTASGLLPAAPGFAGLVAFLFKTRTGYCQQFATAFAVLARIEGLPTRIAVGFLPGTPVGHDEWEVTGSDTHAWPEILFRGYGWIDFEPTPGVTAPGGPVTTGASSTTQLGVTTTTVSTVGPAHNLHPSASGGVTGKAHRPGSGSGPGVLLILSLLIGLALCGWVLAVPAYMRLRLRRSVREPRAGVLAAWSQACRTLDLAGVRRRRAETYLELARRVASIGLLSKEAELALYDLAELATIASYAAVPPAQPGIERAFSDARTVVHAGRERVARWQLVAAALDPRGVPA